MHGSTGSHPLNTGVATVTISHYMFTAITAQTVSWSLAEHVGSTGYVDEL